MAAHDDLMATVNELTDEELDMLIAFVEHIRAQRLRKEDGVGSA